MAISNTVDSMKEHISDAYGIAEEKGATLPADKNLKNLSDCIASISGGGQIVSKGVDFIDYDGTLVASYTPAEVQNLTELPAAPTHAGLTFDGWNWTLAKLKQLNRNVVVGAMYYTSSGACEFDIEITPITTNTVTLKSLTDMTSIDWGDGTTNTELSHTYTDYGMYTIKVYGVTTLGSYVFNQSSSTKNYTLKAIRCSNTLESFGGYAFDNCTSLQYVNMASTVTQLNGYVFRNCSTLRTVIIGSGITSTGGYLFVNDFALTNLSIANTNKIIVVQAFMSCASLKSIVVTDYAGFSIGDNCFASCSGILVYDFSLMSSIPPMNNTNVFSGINQTAKIIVPDALYNSWITASRWSTYADYIYKASEV